MAESSSLEGLQNLHRDLVALCENRLPNLERLWIQLQDRVEEFRKLLDKPPRNEVSRKSLGIGQTFDTRLSERLLIISQGN